jgi:hypothetical protein
LVLNDHFLCAVLYIADRELNRKANFFGQTCRRVTHTDEGFWLFEKMLNRITGSKRVRRNEFETGYVAGYRN